MINIKRIVICCIGLGGLLAFLYSFVEPRREGDIEKVFSEKRSAFEELKKGLQAEEGLIRIGHDEILVKKGDGLAFLPKESPEAKRYGRFWDLLKQTKVKMAFRDKGATPDITFQMRARGFLGEPRYEGICWREFPPKNVVENPDGQAANKLSVNGPVVYKQLGSGWYLWRDL